MYNAWCLPNLATIVINNVDMVESCARGALWDCSQNRTGHRLIRYDVRGPRQPTSIAKQSNYKTNTEQQSTKIRKHTKPIQIITPYIDVVSICIGFVCVRILVNCNSVFFFCILSVLQFRLAVWGVPVTTNSWKLIHTNLDYFMINTTCGLDSLGAIVGPHSEQASVRLRVLHATERTL
jgi:hypothetical protein